MARTSTDAPVLVDVEGATTRTLIDDRPPRVPFGGEWIDAERILVGRSLSHLGDRLAEFREDLEIESCDFAPDGRALVVFVTRSSRALVAIEGFLEAAER